MERGNVPAALLFGLERSASDPAGHDEHHDHSHVAMQSSVVRLVGPIDRVLLEQRLQGLIQRHNLLRLKGRAWLPGKTHPLQIQAVGPRLECWFDTSSQLPPGEPGLELVALGLSLDPTALEQELQPILGLASV